MDKYIDREAANAAAALIALTSIDRKMTCGEVKKIMENIPAADVKPVVRGEWIVRGQDIFCSICNNESGYSPFGASAFSDFCPNCGADMRKKEADE